MSNTSVDTRTVRRIAGLAGLAYVAGVGIENMEVLDSATLGTSAGDIRSAYEDQAFAIVTHAAGALALIAYVVFVLALFATVRSRRRGNGWAVAGLVGGIAGPLLAAAGLAASVPLVADPTGYSDDTTTTLHELYLIARMVAGPFTALFLVGMGTAALRAQLLPRWLVVAGYVIAAPLVLTPLGPAGQALEVGVGIAFALDTLWIFLAGLALTLADSATPAIFARRAAFLVLVIAAGLVGVGLLAVPGATETFFAWGLGPEPLAAFAGGVYVGAAALYAIGLAQPWRRVQGLVAGAVMLSVSVLVATLAHLDQFDFDRLQAWMWVFLFASFATIMVTILVTGRSEGAEPPRMPLPGWVRGTLAVVASLLGILAARLWIGPTGASDQSPFALSPLGGGFAGCWVALLAVLSGWGAVRNDVEETRLPALGLVLLPTGALVASVRTISDLDSGALYIAALSVLIVLGCAVAVTLRPQSVPGLKLASS